MLNMKENRIATNPAIQHFSDQAVLDEAALRATFTKNDPNLRKLKVYTCIHKIYTLHLQYFFTINFILSCIPSCSYTYNIMVIILYFVYFVEKNYYKSNL